MSRGPLVLGDMGHALCRLSRARATCRPLGFDIKEVHYPGFEGRPRAVSLDAFFEAVEMQVDIYRLSHARPLIYATGLGSLVLLGLRARGKVQDLPAVIQGAVPWLWARERTQGSAAVGEEARLSLSEPEARERFIQEHIHSPMDRSEREAFFAGYATCTAFPDVYEWFESGWLASLEGTLAGRPPAINDIQVWLCGEDGHTDEAEHDATMRALGAAWPTERVETWGHFPYLDAPGPWTSALEALIAVK